MPKTKTLAFYSFRPDLIRQGDFSRRKRRRGAMDILEETVLIYERLRKIKYRVIVDTGEDFIFGFQPANYHHLAGIQHLTDLYKMCIPESKDLFYRDIKNGKVREKDIRKSAKFHEIEERLYHFGVLEEILEEGDARIIVEYNRDKISSKIDAKYYLYKRFGSRFDGSIRYHILFIGQNERRYFPATYIIEHSNIYIRNQELHFCKIKHC